MNFETALRSKYEGDNERVGFILRDGTIVEVTNIAENPTEGFEVSTTDIMRYANDAAATWHTHPNETANLSLNDYETFLGWPDLNHIIVGKDDTAVYFFQDGELLRE